MNLMQSCVIFFGSIRCDAGAGVVQISDHFQSSDLSAPCMLVAKNSNACFVYSFDKQRLKGFIYEVVLEE